MKLSSEQDRQGLCSQEAYNLWGGVGRIDKMKLKVNSHGDKSYEESKTGYCNKTDMRWGRSS